MYLGRRAPVLDLGAVGKRCVRSQRQSVFFRGRLKKQKKIFLFKNFFGNTLLFKKISNTSLSSSPSPAAHRTSTRQRSPSEVGEATEKDLRLKYRFPIKMI